MELITIYELGIFARRLIMTIQHISQKGGVRKSTLAQALVSEAQKQKIKVLLADCDSQQANLVMNKKIS